MDLPSIVEALLFASPEAITSEDLAKAIRSAGKESQTEVVRSFAKTRTPEVAGAIEELVATYEKEGRSFTLVERPRGWRIVARPEFAEWARHLFPEKRAERLSVPALETLAIIAYRQPVTKAGIEAIRGVSVDGVLQKLLERDLVTIGGRADLPGRPMLYETTPSFFDHFGIGGVEDLPDSEELRRIDLPTGEEEAMAGEKQLTLGAGEGEESGAGEEEE